MIWTNVPNKTIRKHQYQMFPVVCSQFCSSSLMLKSSACSLFTIFLQLQDSITFLIYSVHISGKKVIICIDFSSILLKTTHQCLQRNKAHHKTKLLGSRMSAGIEFLIYKRIFLPICGFDKTFKIECSELFIYGDLNINLQPIVNSVHKILQRLFQDS